MKIRIIVDPTLCIGAASCVTVSPLFFQLNDENKAVVLDTGEGGGHADRTYKRTLEVAEDQLDEILLAAQSCPTTAIIVYNEETGEKLFPKA
jgi:ferredoxin